MALSLNDIYLKLLHHFGRQNWWPAETPFEVIVGAILTQNTAWKNVEKSINILKENRLLSPERLVAMSDNELAEYIKSSGFYNLKAKRLKNFLFFFQTYKFSLDKLKKEPAIREKLLNIKGIGKETADSIILYALELPIFVVDAYTKRVFYRLGFLESEDVSYDSVQDLFHSSLPMDNKFFNEYHALIVELAKNYCKKNPVCKGCPVTKDCYYQKKCRDTRLTKNIAFSGVQGE